MVDYPAGEYGLKPLYDIERKPTLLYREYESPIIRILSQTEELASWLTSP